MRTSITRLLTLAATLLFALPATASETRHPSLSSVFFEDGRSIRWYALDPVHCGSFGHDVRRCQGVDIERVITLVPAELAVQSEGWFGEDAGSLLDVVPANVPMRVVVYNPSTGSILSRTPELRGDQRDAHVQRQIEIIRDLDLQPAAPLHPRALLDALGDTLDDLRVDDRTGVLLIAPGLSGSDDLRPTRDALNRLPAAHYTVFDHTTFLNARSAIIPLDLGSTFLTRGPARDAHSVQELVFQRLEVEFGPPSLRGALSDLRDRHHASISHDRHKKKKRCRLDRRGKHRHWGKRVFLVFWYSLGFFALVYLLSRRRRRDDD